MQLDTELGNILLERARQAIEVEVDTRSSPPRDDPALEKRGATFVTLTAKGELRGCMGSVRAQRSLREDVAANAVAAAMRDPRFSPVTAAEMKDIRVEVSLLSEPKFLDFSDEDQLLAQVRPSVDGLMLFAGCRSATFLPQVWEKLPDPALFLAALKQKAGLSPDRPAENLMAATYTVQKWEESR